MRKFLKPALAILPLAILGACTSDEIPVDDTGRVAEKSEIRYLQVSICSPDNSYASGSRADGDPLGGETDANDNYFAGSDEENRIRTVDFYFYDDHKNYLSHTNLKAAGYNDPGYDEPADPHADPSDPKLDIDPTATIDNVEAVYHCNVPITLTQGDRLPAYVLCIVNAVNPNAYEDKPMADAQRTLLYSLYDIETKKYFGMNNSVYYGTDQVTGEENQLIMATPFNTDLLKTAADLETPAANEKEERLNIYVERYAAKVNLKLGQDATNTPFTASMLNTSENGTDNSDVTLTFTPEKWGLNAYEKSFYLIKCYREKDDPTDFESFSSLDNYLFTGWNRPGHFRSFWARTPGYYDNNYPIVTDDILDALGTTKYEPNKHPELNGTITEWITGYPYSVFYSSYNSASGKVGTPQYVIETTLKQNRLNGTDMPSQYLPINSIPSVVLIGKYTVNVNGTDYSDKTFYTYSHNATNDKPYVLAANAGELGNVPTLKETLIKNQNIVLIEKDGIKTPVLNSDLTAEGDDGIFTVEHPSKAVRNDGSMKVPGDIVTLQIKKLNGKKLYYYSSKANVTSYVEITESNMNDVNRLLYKNLGGAHQFTKGKAFFTAPIQHWGWYRANNNAESITDAEGNRTGWSGGNNGRPMAEWDWSKMKAGDFGIVRNHVYTINVTSITGLGTGIIDDDDPLLPSADKIGYNIHFDIFIQKWGMLPEQTWEW